MHYLQRVIILYVNIAACMICMYDSVNNENLRSQL